MFNAREQQPALATQMLGRFRQLYDIEDRGRTMDDAQRLELRQRESVAVMNRLRELLDSEAAQRVLPKSKFGQALGYLRNHWSAFEVYLGDARVPIDNSDVERDLRRIALGRTNWLFVGSEAAGSVRPPSSPSWPVLTDTTWTCGNICVTRWNSSRVAGRPLGVMRARSTPRSSTRCCRTCGPSPTPNRFALFARTRSSVVPRRVASSVPAPPHAGPRLTSFGARAGRLGLSPRAHRTPRRTSRTHHPATPGGVRAAHSRRDPDRVRHMGERGLHPRPSLSHAQSDTAGHVPHPF